MFCGRCGAENAPGRKFCTSCGAPLELTCLHCGGPLAPTDAFCGECGTPNPGVARPATAPLFSDLPSGPAQALAAERRLVSVLFVDLVGFTAYSDGRDAEDVRLFLSDYFQRAEEIVGLYGGVVEKFIGDAVMAVWGSPVAREDDTERAVRAAVELLASVVDLGRSVDVDLRARAGIFTGEAAVNLAAKGQGMVAGDMVNTASRLQSAAEPGSILVDRSTFLGARDAVAFEEVEPLSLKGKQEPVDAWRVLRVVAGRKGFRSGAALEPAFNGRDEEFRLIKDLLHATGRERKPRLASILGVAGVGKSRIVWEFFKYIDGLTEVINWHQGRSPSYGEGVGFWALAEMVRMRAEIAETDDDATVARKLNACLDEYVPDAAEREWLKPYLARLLGLVGAEETDRDQQFAAWRTFFERVADRETTVLIFEDLQWADTGLIDFIEHLMAWARSSPIFIVTLARPELLDRRPTWGAGQRNFVSVHLEPLGEDDMTLLLKSISGELPETIRSEIIERAEGVPLYAVEMIRVLVDRGELVPNGTGYRWVGQAEHVDVPDSLHALIASRLDSLDVRDRLLVQDASVLGKTFTLEALQAVSRSTAAELEPRLSDLVRRDLLTVDTDPRSPERGQFGFVQSLIREVAYQTLSNENRKERHLVAAEFFAATGVADLIDVVANHFVEAYNNARPGDEAESLAVRARESLVEAAQRANSLGAWSQAQGLLEKAVEITPEASERGRLLYMAGEAATSAGDTFVGIDHLQAAIELLRAEGQKELLAKAQQQLGGAYFFAGRLDEAEAVLLAGIEELDNPSTSPAAASLYGQLARIYVFKAQYEKSEEYVNRAMPPAEMNEDIAVIADALITRGVACVYQGRSHEAGALLRGALSLSTEHDLLGPRIRALINIAANQLFIDPAEALATAQSGYEIARRIGTLDSVTFLLANSLEAALMLAKWDVAAEIAVQIEDLVGPSPNFIVVSCLALWRAFKGDVEEADRLYENYVGLVTDSSSYEDRRGVSALRCSLSLLRCDLPQAVEAAHTTKIFDHEFTGLYGFVGRAATWAGDLELAQATLDHENRSSLRNPWQRCRTKTLEAAMAAVWGTRDEALSLYRDVLEDWDAVGLRLGKAFCQMDLALLVGGKEGREAAVDATPFFEELGNPYLLDRLRSAV